MRLNIKTHGLIACIFTASVFVLVGCSESADSTDGGKLGRNQGSEPETRDVEEVRAEAQTLSSGILDVMDLKGKVTEPGPDSMQCDGREDSKFYVMNHPWSLYDVPVEDLKKAMHRLREELPRRGWKITKYGPDGSKVKSLQIRANSLKKKFTVDIVLQDRRGRSSDPSMIEVTLVSACFKAPDDH